MAGSGSRLFHFSERGDIQRFDPRPLDPPRRWSLQKEWLNGPLVWAIDEWHQPLYLFPRDMPRIVYWPLSESSAEDLARWWHGRSCKMVALIEPDERARLTIGHTWRYELPPQSFETIDDAGMHISHEAVEPISVERLCHLVDWLAGDNVMLETCDDFESMRPLWHSTLHASGIHLDRVASWRG